MKFQKASQLHTTKRTRHAQELCPSHFCKGFREDKQGAECEDARTGKPRKRFSFSDDSRQNIDYRQG